MFYNIKCFFHTFAGKCKVFLSKRMLREVW